MASQETIAANPGLNFWNVYDPHKEDLNVEVVLEWDDDFGHYQLIRYHVGKLVGSNQTACPIIAAYFGYPKQEEGEGATAFPGLLHIHGGGHTADKRRVSDWTKLGYACISINWGGKVLEEADTPNTDWDGLAAGFVRPGVSDPDLVHHEAVRGGPHTLMTELHILNCSYLLVSIAARRALTFLERQPQVDPDRLGIEGHSMGGKCTVLTAIDSRVKVVSPSVGGSGYLYGHDFWGLPGSTRKLKKGDGGDGLDFYNQCVGAQVYWPHIHAPVLFLGATNDFNAPSDLVPLGMQGQMDRRMLTLAPHLNHRFTPSTEAARFMWMETHLKGTFNFPKTSTAQLILKKGAKPLYEVTVDDSCGLPVVKVEVYYGYARDPRIRFWRSAHPVTNTVSNVYQASCPIFDVNEPVFCFANITYRMPKSLPRRWGVPPTDLLTVSSQYQSAYPENLTAAGVVATEQPQCLLDDFSRGWQDWYRLNYTNRHHWFYSTRKMVDPCFVGPNGAKLAVGIKTTTAGDTVAVGVEANEWQQYRKAKVASYHCIRKLPEAGVNSIVLDISDFVDADGEALEHWDEVTQLTFQPASNIDDTVDLWKGDPPELRNLCWRGGAHWEHVRQQSSSISEENTEELQELNYANVCDDETLSPKAA